RSDPVRSGRRRPHRGRGTPDPRVRGFGDLRVDDAGGGRRPSPAGPGAGSHGGDALPTRADRGRGDPRPRGRGPRCHRSAHEPGARYPASRGGELRAPRRPRRRRPRRRLRRRETDRRRAGRLRDRRRRFARPRRRPGRRSAPRRGPEHLDRGGSRSMSTATARAFPNIALVKYWGKRDEELILPVAGSLSLTLDAFPTTTTVTLTPGAEADSFSLGGSTAAGEPAQRVTRFLDHVRALAGSDVPAQVVSMNEAPTGAGLASS